jgi:hypothetical protein
MVRAAHPAVNSSGVTQAPLIEAELEGNDQSFYGIFIHLTHLHYMWKTNEFVVHPFFVLEPTSGRDERHARKCASRRAPGSRRVSSTSNPNPPKSRGSQGEAAKRTTITSAEQ